MPLPVLLDATPLARGHAQRGIGAVVGGLIDHLPAEDRPTLLVTDDQEAPEGFELRRVRWPQWRPARVPDPWPALRLEPRLRRMQPALFHASQPDLVPDPRRVPVVMKVYDLIPLHMPMRNPLFRHAYAGYLQRVRAAPTIVVASQATADDLTAQLGIPPSRMHVVPYGTPVPVAPAGDTPDRPYVLYANAIEAHKNPELAIDALAHLPDVRLVMTGMWSGRRLGVLRERAERLGVAGRIDWLGWIPAPLLAALRRDAVATLVTSRLEGFGLPVLESLAVGTPVVASDIPVLREVGGSAAAYAPLDDPVAWARAIEAAAAPNARAVVAATGPARAGLFTWERSARDTVRVWKRVLAGG